MAANKPNSLSNKESHLVDPMLSETESTSYDFSFGAAAPEAATYTNSRPVLEQPAVLPQPARTLSHTKPISDHSTLPNASANAPRKRRHSHFEQEGDYILHHQLEAYTQVTELPDTNVHTALPTLPTAGSLTSTVEQLDHARFNEQYSNADRLYQGMWQRPAPGFANDNLLGTPNTLPYPHGFLQGYVGNLYATTSSRSLAITHQAPPPFRPLAAPRVPSPTTAGLSIDLSHVIPITQPLPPIDMPVDQQLSYIRPPLNTLDAGRDIDLLAKLVDLT